MSGEPSRFYFGSMHRVQVGAFKQVFGHATFKAYLHGRYIYYIDDITNKLI